MRYEVRAALRPGPHGTRGAPAAGVTSECARPHHERVRV